MTDLILNNKEIAFALLALLGVMGHWFIKAYNNEISWNILDYWLKNHAGRSASTVIVFGGAVWAVTTGDTLESISVEALVMMAVTLGWTIDSGVNKGTSKDVEAASRARTR